MKIGIKMTVMFLLAWRWMMARVNEMATEYISVTNKYGEEISYHITIQDDYDIEGEIIPNTERTGVRTIVEKLIGMIGYEIHVDTFGTETEMSVSWHYGEDSGRDMDNLPTIGVRELMRMLRELDASVRRHAKGLPSMPIITYGVWYDGDDQMDRRISLYKRWAARIEADGVALVDVIESAPAWAYEEYIPEDIWVSVEGKNLGDVLVVGDMVYVDNVPVAVGDYTPIVYCDANGDEMSGDAFADLMDDVA